jgi:hypothetical protein
MLCYGPGVNAGHLPGMLRLFLLSNSKAMPWNTVKIYTFKHAGKWSTFTLIFSPPTGMTVNNSWQIHFYNADSNSSLPAFCISFLATGLQEQLFVKCLYSSEW